MRIWFKGKFCFFSTKRRKNLCALLPLNASVRIFGWPAKNAPKSFAMGFSIFESNDPTRWAL